MSLKIFALALNPYFIETVYMATGSINTLSPFLSPRGGSNAWAQHLDVIDAWKRRSQIDVPPKSMEYAPIVSCDADCPLCPFRRSRLKVCNGLIPHNETALEDDVQAASSESAMRVLEAACEAGVTGVLFTGGGEPLRWSPLLDMLAYSAKLGMVNSLYTNGFRLGLEETLANQLLSPETGLVFVRMSINALSPERAKRHWGLDVEHVTPQLVGLARLFQARQRWLSEYRARGQRLPSIQISTIVDQHNVADLSLICETIAEIVSAHRVCEGEEDVMIVRPLTIHGRKNGYSLHDHNELVVRQIISVCGKQGSGYHRLADAGMVLYLGFGLSEVESGAITSYSALLEREYALRDISWANGLFLTVGADSSVYLSTEYNCDPNWSLGNLKTQAVSEIYGGSLRRNMLDHMNSLRWGPIVSQPTSRTTRLDRIAKAIMNGVLSDHEIEIIRLASLDSHPLILD